MFVGVNNHPSPVAYFDTFAKCVTAQSTFVKDQGEDTLVEGGFTGMSCVRMPVVKKDFEDPAVKPDLKKKEQL
jgi:hypothetical protein